VSAIKGFHISSGMFKSNLIWMRHVAPLVESWRTHE